MTFKVKQLLSI
uniref:Uncharacterized protein n=1 Tax=Rhizophora mucronata TaxID=61149 RepID=A0A2P2MSK8_RHIMU